MKARSKKAKKYRYTKDCKEQPKETCNDVDKQYCHEFKKVVIEESFKPHKQEDSSQGTKTFGPEEMNAMVLTKRKETAEAILGKKSTHAVVTDLKKNYHEVTKQKCNDVSK